MAKDYIFAVKSLPARARSNRRRASGVGGTTVVNSGGSSGGSSSETVIVEGHTHDNKSLLDSESVDNGGYLLVGGTKVNAGHADTAGTASEATHASSAATIDPNSVLWGKFLRKDVADTAQELITFVKGLISTAAATFNGGISVSGGADIDDLEIGNDLTVQGDGAVAGILRVVTKLITALAEITTLSSTSITTENLTVTKAAHFFKLVIDELVSNKGAIIITSANCKADVVVSGGTVSGVTYYDVFFRATDADGAEITNGWRTGDMAICMAFNGLHTGLNENVTSKYYWRKVTSVASNVTRSDGNVYHRIRLSNYGTNYDPNSTGVPEAGDEIVQLGYNPSWDSSPLTGSELSSRQGAMILSAYVTPDAALVPPLFAFYGGIDGFALSSHRQTYFSAGGSKVVGDFSAGTINGNSLLDYITAQLASATAGMELQRMDLSNQMSSIGVDSFGTVLTTQRLSTAVRIYNGASLVPITTSNVSAGALASASASLSSQDGVVTVSWEISADWELEDAVKYESEIVVTVPINGTSRTFRGVFTAGVVHSGAAGVSPTIYELVPDADAVAFKRDSNDALTPSYVDVYCNYKRIIGSTTTVVTGSRTAGPYNIYRRYKYLYNGNYVWSSWYGSRYLRVYPSYPELEFCLSSASSADLVTDSNIVDRESVPVTCDGAKGNTGASGQENKLADCGSKVEAQLNGNIGIALVLGAWKYIENVGTIQPSASIYWRMRYVSTSGKTGTNYSSSWRQVAANSPSGATCSVTDGIYAYAFTISVSTTATTNYNHYSNVLGVELQLRDGNSVLATGWVPISTQPGALFTLDTNLGLIEGRVQDAEGSISTIRQEAERISLSVETGMGSGYNYLDATDFVSLSDVDGSWVRSSTPSAAAGTAPINSRIYWSRERYLGQSLMALDMSALQQQVSHMLKLRQDVLNSTLAGLQANTKLCLSMYAKVSSVDDPDNTYIGMDLVGGDGMVVDSFEYIGDGIDAVRVVDAPNNNRHYGQCRFKSTTWKRVWVVFHCTDASLYSSITVGLYAWRSDTAPYSTQPTVYIAMPKLEIGDHPTAWSAEKEQLRRTGIDITKEEIHLEGLVTANKGFAIGLDGSVEANNGTFAGFVRTKPRVIQASNLSSYMMGEDYVDYERVQTASTIQELSIPYHVTAGCKSIDLLKSGAHIIFYGSSSMTALVHLPFSYPHKDINYSNFDYAYAKGITTQGGEGVMPSSYNGDGKKEARWNLCCPEVLRIRSFVGCQIEIANMSGGNIVLCGLLGTLVNRDSSQGAFAAEDPWQQVLLPTKAVLRATCVRVTESGSNISDIEKIYWRPDSYCTLDFKYTAAALGLT